MSKKRRLWLAAALMGLSALAACGGGGGSGGDLQVRFEYPQQTQNFRLFDSVSIAPVVEGLGGAKAHFAVRSGGRPLPQGVSLDERSGSIGGYAGQVGLHPVWVDLTADGYGGSVSSVLTISITSDISLTYPSAGIYGRVNSPISPRRPTVTGLQTGDVASNFRLQSPPGAAASALPPGVVLDARTGVVFGTPTAPGKYAAFIAMTVTRSGKQATIQAPSYLYFSIN